MPDITTKTPSLFDTSWARNLAESKWGRPCFGYKTRRKSTNRKGAFWFACSSGAGYIIDGRCLTHQERAAIVMTEYSDTDGVVRLRTNPYARARITYKIQSTWQKTNVPIYALNAVHQWSLPVLFAGITAESQNAKKAFTVFQRGYNPSAHEVIEIHAAMET